MAVLTLVRQVDVGKIMRQAAVMLRVLLCFDIFFLVSSCVQLVWMTPAVITKEDGSWDLSFLTTQQYLHNYSLLSLFSTTLICNSMAKAAITNGKRMLILPWLIVFMGIKILLVLCFITDVIYNPFSASQIFMLLLMMCVMSAWRHMQVVFVVMGLPRPLVTDSEASPAHVAAKTDFPPKYEDVTEAEKPPRYDEATMTQQ